MRFLCLLMALLLAGCHRSYLDVRSEALYPSYLASEKIDAPDPNRLAFYGQQIVIHWRLPPDCFDAYPFEILLTIRYKDFTFQTFSYPISDRRGYWVYQLLNDEYWEKGGILSYKVELYKEDELFDEWQHHVWADWIEISKEV